MKKILQKWIFLENGKGLVLELVRDLFWSVNAMLGMIFDHAKVDIGYLECDLF